MRWTRACDIDGYDGIITGGDIVVYFLGPVDEPDAISVDRGRTRGVVHGMYGTRVQIDQLPAHEWWPYTGGLTYEMEVGKAVKEMLSGKVIRYGRGEHRSKMVRDEKTIRAGRLQQNAQGRCWLLEGAPGRRTGHRYTPDQFLSRLSRLPRSPPV